MPTYDYVCEACGHHFEHFQSMSSRKKRKCPECGQPKLVRQVGSGAGLIFKGSGFYETDYKKSSSPSPEKASPKDKEASPEETSTPSKASKTEKSDTKDTPSNKSDE